MTIIVATYNRADSLKQTIRCAIAQSFTDWSILVIGDWCSDHTAQVISHFDDERIQFINLPERFGEQAGPNSVGIMLAETEFIAFLNHDDLWLRDHLLMAITQLENEKTDIYWSRTAFYENRGPRTDTTLFTRVSPMNRTLAGAYDNALSYSEPISSWVCKADSLKKLGVMSLSSEVSITPLQDYAARAWQQNFQLSNNSCVTVVKDLIRPVNLPNESKRYYYYDLDDSDKEELVQAIERDQTSVLLKKIEADLWGGFVPC